MRALSETPLPSEWTIFGYSSLRSALGGFLAAKRREEPRAWSLGGWAKRLQVGSSATLTNVLKGRRVPSPPLAEKLAHSLGLEGNARDYFDLLVELDRTPPTADEIRRGIAKRLLELRVAGSARVLDDIRFRAVADPRHLIVKEMIHLRDFREDEEWIGARMSPAISADEVRRSIATLLRVGLLERTAGGKLRTANAIDDTSHDVPSEAHRRYHHECLDLAKTALESTSVALRDFTNTIVSIDPERLPEMKERLKAFSDEFLGTFDTTDGRASEVYHLGFQLYPVTKSGKDKIGHA